MSKRAASPYAKLAISLFRKAKPTWATPIGAFFQAGRSLRMSVTVQGKDETYWRERLKKSEDAVYEALDRPIKVTAGRERLVFDWTDCRRMTVR